MCPACAPVEPNTFTFPGPPPANDTPHAAADPTPPAPAGERDPFALTNPLPGEAVTASAPAAPASDSKPLPPDPVGYTLLERIGEGGMGEVFRAHEHSTDQFVALKMINTRRGGGTYFERFRREFRALANFEHEHAVRGLKDRFDHDPPFFTMELVRGCTVADRLKSAGRYEPREAVELIRKVALAVQALHDHKEFGYPSAGVIHRDIKPSNILLTAGVEPKLADFGLVKYLDADTLTNSDGGLGTPAYMPPEQCAGQCAALGYTADVYGLGATLYHMLTGHPPFRGTVPEIVTQVLTADPEPVCAVAPEVGEALSNIVRACVHKRPEDRYQTVAALIAALDAWLAGQRPPPPPRTFWRRARRWAKRNAVALSACALLGVVGVLALVWPPRDPERAITAGLRAGRAQTLIGENGPTVSVRWFARRPEREVPKGDAPFGALCPDQSLAVFLSDPGIESYRLSGEFVQDVKLGDVAPGARAPAKTGLLLGHTPVTFGDGRTVHFATTLAFNDYDTPAVPKQDCRLEFEDWIGIDFPLEQLRRRKYGGPTIKLDRPAANDRARRAFTAEVRPTGITVAMNGKTVVFTRESIQKDWDAAAADVARTEPALPPFAAPQWSPRSGIGVALFRTWSSVYDLRIEPLS